MPNNNNEKKRFGRKAAFTVVSASLTTIAFYVCLIVFVVIESKAEVGLKWWLMYALFTFGTFGLGSGLLTITDVKSLLPFVKK